MAVNSAVLSTNRRSQAGVDSNIFAPSLGYNRGWRIMLSISTKGAELQTPWVFRKYRRDVLRGISGWSAAAVLALGACQCAAAAPAPPPSDKPAVKTPLLQLGPGDSVSVQVYGQPDLSTTVYVGDDGTVSVPLAGNIQVAGLSPAQASSRIEAALKSGKILVDPHVTLTVTQTRSQRVSVLGQVGAPGRYAVESNTTIFDLLAQAGGITATGSDIVYIIRLDKDGKEVRFPVDLRGLANGSGSIHSVSLQGGDSVFVPKAEQFSIYGEVTTPGRYRVEPGMTVIEAIARAGGITLRGSQRRVEIKRKQPSGDYSTMKVKLGDLIQPDDVVQVKESIF
jgi:polysaccharide export outer membrane protein